MTELHPFIIQLGLEGLSIQKLGTPMFSQMFSKNMVVHDIITRLKTYTPQKHKHLYANIPQLGALCWVIVSSTLMLTDRGDQRQPFIKTRDNCSRLMSFSRNTGSRSPYWCRVVLLWVSTYIPPYRVEVGVCLACLLRPILRQARINERL